jgi:hypothetical protein
VVADVCRHVSPADPRSVSQSGFDGARGDAGHPRAPSARQIATRLRLPWQGVKDLALDPKRSVDRAVGRRTGKQSETWITDDVCIAALRTVAAGIGKDVPLTIARYEVEAERMLADDRRRYVHGRRLVMPNVDQIEWRLGPWPQALVRAGLTPPVQTGEVGSTWIDGIELCLEATGCLVSSATLLKWFEINDLSLAIWTPGMTYRGEVEKLRVRRAAQGKWAPPRYTTPREQPDLLSVVPGLTGPAKRRRPRFDEGRALEVMKEFVRDRRGSSQTRKSYIRWKPKMGDKPAASSMNRFDRPGFAAYREQARRMLREEENG